MCTEDYSESQTLLLPKSCGEAPMGKKACRGHFSPTQFHFRLWPGHCWRKQKNRGAQLYRSKRRRGNMVFQVSGWGVFSELTASSRGRGECLFIDTETILVVNMKHLLYFQGRSLPRSEERKRKTANATSFGEARGINSNLTNSINWSLGLWIERCLHHRIM